MSIREELLKTIETMNEENLEELLEYARWLQADRAELSPEERVRDTRLLAWKGRQCRTVTYIEAQDPAGRKLTEALRKLTEREERRPWWVRILKRGR